MRDRFGLRPRVVRVRGSRSDSWSGGPRRLDDARLRDDEPTAARVRRRMGFRRHRCRRRCGRRRRRRSRVGRRSRRRRQEPERVEVAELVGCQADPQMDVRNGLLGRAARPDSGHCVTFRDGRALRDGERAEMREGHRVPIGRLDRKALATRRDEAGEAHRPGRGRDDRIALRRGTDVDAAVLAGGVRVRLVVRERLEHGAMDGPAPRVSDRRPDEEDGQDCCQF